MLKLLAWVAGTLLVLIGLGLAYLQFADLRAPVEWAAGRLLDRELRIDGAFEVDLLPAPRILAEGVTLGNASWSDEPVMLRAEHLSARVDGWSLLAGPPRVHEINARDVQVLVETDAVGSSNWSPTGATSAPASPEPPTVILESLTRLELPVVLERADVSGVAITVRAPDAVDRRIVVDALSMTLDDAGGQETQLIATVMEVPLTLQGRLARDAEHNVSLALEGTLGDLSLTMDGALGVGSSLVATVAADDLSALLHDLQVDLPLAGALRVGARVTATADGFELDADAAAGSIRSHWLVNLTDGAIDFDTTLTDLSSLAAIFHVDGLPRADLQVGGRLQGADGSIEIADGTARLADATATFDLRATAGELRAAIDAEGPRLADLGFDLPDAPFRLATTIERTDKALLLEPLQLELGDSDLAGSLHITSYDPPRLAARLTARKLDLTPYQPDPDASPAEPAVATTPSPYLFEPSPLPFDDLNTADIDLQVTVDELIQGHLKLQALDLSLTLAAANLEGQLAFRSPDGGAVRSSATLRADSQPAHLAVQAEADAVRLNLMSGAVASPEQIPAVSVLVDLQARGSSPRDLAASATGHVLFSQGRGRIDMGAAVPLLTGDLLTRLLQTLNPFSRQTPYSDLECSVILLTLEEGDGRMPVMLMQDQRVQVIGQGTADMRNEKLAIEFKTQPRQGIGVSADMFVTPFVVVSGTFMRPTLGMNKRGVLLHGGAAFLTGGLSIVGEALLSRRKRVTDPCEVAGARARSLIEADATDD